jgi:hypothetical protein
MTNVCAVMSLVRVGRVGRVVAPPAVSPSSSSPTQTEPACAKDRSVAIGTHPGQHPPRTATLPGQDTPRTAPTPDSTHPGQHPPPATRQGVEWQQRRLLPARLPGCSVAPPDAHTACQSRTSRAPTAMQSITKFLRAVRAEPTKLPDMIKSQREEEEDAERQLIESGGVVSGPSAQESTDCRRAVYWRMFAKLLDSANPDGWADALVANRERYHARKSEVLTDPSKQEDENLDSCNPLSMDEDNPYQKYFKTQQLVEEIDRDLERCCISGVPDDFFQQPEILRILRGVLAVWATDHPETSYRQGMHEVLGVVILALRPLQLLVEKVGSGGDGGGGGSDDDSSEADLVRTMADADQLEADIHFVFDFILRDLQRLYRVQTDAERKAQLAKIKAAAKISGSGGMGGTDGLSMQAPLQVRWPDDPQANAAKLGIFVPNRRRRSHLWPHHPVLMLLPGSLRGGAEPPHPGHRPQAVRPAVAAAHRPHRLRDEVGSPDVPARVPDRGRDGHVGFHPLRSGAWPRPAQVHREHRRQHGLLRARISHEPQGKRSCDSRGVWRKSRANGWRA